jgi:pimeloyl-ACP methyl ester carboxylesterase
VPANELKALGELAAESVDVTVATPVQDMHRAIAARVFRSVGPAAEPVRVVHDSVASSVYGGLRAAGTAAGAAAGAAVEKMTGPGDVRVLERSGAGRLAQAAINALLGDRLEERASDVRIEMAVRHGGRDMVLDAGALAAAFPRATARIAVFVHGLGEDEGAWRLRAARGGATYGSRLREDLGFTPLHLRYNTGLHISDNGRRLSLLLEALAAAWPVAVKEVLIVGHSMGGLVARAACHAAVARGHRWPAAVRHVVFLGSPHLGAPLEKIVNASACGLGIAPEVRAFANVLNTRSAGIKDLRFGYVCEDDWRDRDPDAFLHNARRTLPAPELIVFHHIAATLTERDRHPIGMLAGDLLVRYASATGRGIPAARATTRHFGRRTHFDLLNDPEVYVHLRDCITRG